MVVYPVFGTITPYADAAQALPGVVKGQSPTTAMAILGGGPQLVSSDLPLPAIDGNAEAMLVSESDIIATPYSQLRLERQDHGLQRPTERLVSVRLVAKGHVACSQRRQTRSPL